MIETAPILALLLALSIALNLAGLMVERGNREQGIVDGGSPLFPVPCSLFPA